MIGSVYLTQVYQCLLEVSVRQSLRLDYSEVFSIRFLVLDLISFIAEKALSHTYVFSNRRDNISKENLWSLGNRSLEISFQTFSGTSTTLGR